MYNCLILGSGRSGTSMLAGCLAKSGYFMGKDLHAPRDTNPKGFFEAPEINSINESILSKALPKRVPFIGNIISRNIPTNGQRWLARIPLKAKLSSDKNIDQRIAKITSITPFCFKDPRLSYTLPIWLPHLNNTRFLCVFREPSITAKSIIKECNTTKYLSNFHITHKNALMVWMLMYQHIIEIHRHKGDWLFIHYDQILNGQAKNRIEIFLSARFDETFPDTRLKRTTSHIKPLCEEDKIYKNLCALANY